MRDAYQPSAAQRSLAKAANAYSLPKIRHQINIGGSVDIPGLSKIQNNHYYRLANSYMKGHPKEYEHGLIIQKSQPHLPSYL